MAVAILGCVPNAHAVAETVDAAASQPSAGATVPPPAAKVVPEGAAATSVAAASPAATPATPDARVAAASPAPKPVVATTLRVSIDLSRQRMTVKEHGRVVHSWPISSGRAGYHTPTGTFRPQWMSKMHYSRKYDMAPMPHSVFFHGGYAVHGTYATGMLGSPASHGCVRLSPGNAKRFYNLVSRHGRASTVIALSGSTPASRYAKKRRSKTPQYASDYGGGSSFWFGSQPAAPKVRRSAGKPKIIYRNGQAYVYVGRDGAKRSRKRYSGSYYNNY
ncbi:MAG: L,D-transpeptidase [Hyphomicrobiaceae bacterium]|nr:L,D-transpeptidase [Hyphomicrobiaceae bacterium]